jgi:hypothetical protein
MVCPIFGFLDGKWGGTTYMATLSAMLDPSSPILVQPLTGLSLASRASSLLVIMFQSWNLRRRCLQPGARIADEFRHASMRCTCPIGGNCSMAYAAVRASSWPRVREGEQGNIPSFCPSTSGTETFRFQQNNWAWPWC